MTAHYVYRCYDANSRLLYVGQTKNWTSRLSQHSYRAFWAAEVVHVRVSVHRSPEIARALERQAIRNENPRFNLQGRWESRNLWSREDWIDYVRAVTSGHRANSYVNRSHLEMVLRFYAAKFNEPHPADAQMRQEFAVADAKQEELRLRRQLESERIDRLDRLAELEHFKNCPPCGRVGRYADDCPVLLADVEVQDEEQARFVAEVSA